MGVFFCKKVLSSYYQRAYKVVAGNDIEIGAQVYLLYEIPINFLANSFPDNESNRTEIYIHELNGCIVGPGLYQEWCVYVQAARTQSEQNLILYKNQSNKMLMYKAIKKINKGDELYAWYSESLEQEFNTQIDYLISLCNETTCKNCLTNFKYSNILKSHLLFEPCAHELANKRSTSSSSTITDWKFSTLDGTQTVELQIPDNYSGKSKKSHVCLFCGKVYNRKYGLKIHLRTHTGYKPLKCKVCSRPFSDPSNLNKHVRLHSQGETPYKCPYCNKILVRKRDLDRHILSRHANGVCESSI